ncbi:MAG: hypothetical protein BGP13_16025 [Sphingobacteriales bacterium 40-81]|nr:MAG: hypothetical protein BGP13_16025 [Sphingobacteriales bacterium 40-81]
MKHISLFIINIFWSISLPAQHKDTDLPGWRQVSIFPEAITDDGLFGMTKSGKFYVSRSYYDGNFDIKQLRHAHKDETADNLNYILSKAFIKKVLFGDTSNRTIDLNGELYAGTTILQFNGTVILSNCKITGGKLKAPTNIQLFDTTVSLYNTAVNGEFFSAKWFGLDDTGTTVNNKVLEMTFAYAPADKAIWIPGGTFIISKTLHITKSVQGEDQSVLKYYPASLLPNDVMIQVASDNIFVKNLHFNGGQKAAWIIEILNNNRNIEIADCFIQGAEQSADTKVYAAGIRFREGMDGLYIHHCRFTNINASVTGIARGIIGSGRISPKKVIIENNIFDGITSAGAATWDADQIVIQDYTDSAGIIIRGNKHNNISKRGQKLQSPGIHSYKNEFRSVLYKSNSISYSAISAYNNFITIDSNIVQEGVFEKCIEIGVINSTNNNIIIDNNQLNLSAHTGGSNDGIRVFGKQHRNLHITNNSIQNVRKGIWFDCSSDSSIIENNEIKNSLNGAIVVHPVSNKWPDTWNNNIRIVNNKATNVQSYFAYEFSNIHNGVIAFNKATQARALINNRSLDSLSGKVSIYKNEGPQSINYGSANNRPLIKSAFSGLEYYNTDTKKTEIFDGKKWQTKTNK